MKFSQTGKDILTICDIQISSFHGAIPVRACREQTIQPEWAEEPYLRKKTQQNRRLFHFVWVTSE